MYLIFHTTTILLKVMPLNPLSVKVRPLTESYGGLLFNQNWHLFAPTPIMSNNNIYIQVLLKDGETEWFDISTELKEINQNQLITPYNRLVRVIDGIVVDLQGNIQNDLLYRYLIKSSDKSKLHIVDETIKHAEKNLYRYASAHVKHLYPKEEVKAIRVKVISYNLIPFSERHNSKYEQTISYEKLYDWQPLNNDLYSF